MRRTTQCSDQPYTGHAVWSTFSKSECDPRVMAQNICYCFGITDKPFMDLIHQFISGLVRSATGLRLYEVKPFVDSCKARYSELYKLIANLLDYSQIYEVYLSRANGKPFIRESIETEIHFVSSFDDEEIVLNLRLTGHPKIYGYLSKAVVRAIINTCVNEAHSPTELVDVLLPYMQVILSVGQLYNDLHGDDHYKVLREKEILKEVTTPPAYGKELDDLFNQFEQDIQLGFRSPRYCRDIARALMSVRLNEYSVTDYHYSLRKTGTYFQGKSLNGLSASTVETDPGWDFDDMIGYKSHYRTEVLPGTKQPNLKGQTVPQHKLDDRDIRLGSNPLQDRANWYHHILERINRSLECDCTFDQDKGRRFARRCTEMAISDDKCIYCNDIHAATDNISPWFQERCLRIIFGPELAKGWIDLMIRETTYAFSDGHTEVFTPQRGQPQGMKSSFPAFAFAHHILMRLVMLKCGLTDVNPKTWYRVLGDDSIIYTDDTPDLTVYQAYIDLARQMGWEVNESKGYYYFSWTDNTPVAEFAKVRYYGGRPLSPLPLQLTLHLYSEDGLIPAMLFIAHQLADIDLHRFDDCLELAGVGEPQSFFIHQLIKNKVGLWQHIQSEPMNDVELAIAPIVLIHYFRSQLYRTTLSLWLPSEYEHNVFDERARAKKNSLIFLEWLDEINNAADLDSEHKIWQLMFKQESLIEVLEKAIDDASLSYAGLVMDLTPEDQDILETAAELVCDYKFATREEILRVIPLALRILSRYNPRSEARDGLVSASVLPKYALDCIDDTELPFEEVINYVLYFRGEIEDAPSWYTVEIDDEFAGF